MEQCGCSVRLVARYCDDGVEKKLLRRKCAYSARYMFHREKFWRLCMQDTSLMLSHFIQLVFLCDEGLVKPETCTGRSW